MWTPSPRVRWTDGVSLARLARRFGSPLHVVGASCLRRNADAFLRVPRGAQRGCEVFYSYKTNPVPGALRVLHASGVGAEVISPFELWLARKLGVPSARIIVNGPAKTEAFLAEAVRSRVGLLNINHSEELEAVARVARRLGRRPAVGLRVVASGGWGGHFGVPIEGGAALSVFARGLACKELRVTAIHSHFGAPLATRGILHVFLDELLGLADRLFDELGFNVPALDLGGSLPLLSDGGSLSVPGYVAAVVRRVERHYRQAGRPRPRILLEPGRALTGDAQLLLASVVAVKQTPERDFLILDTGMNLAEPLRHERHALSPVSAARRSGSRVYTVVGPTCSPTDVLYPECRLPPMRPGDVVAIHDAGAYFVPSASSFSFPKPAVVMVEKGRPRVLRQAESFEDLIALDGPRRLS